MEWLRLLGGHPQILPEHSNIKAFLEAYLSKGAPGKMTVSCRADIISFYQLFLQGVNGKKNTTKLSVFLLLPCLLPACSASVSLLLMKIFWALLILLSITIGL